MTHTTKLLTTTACVPVHGDYSHSLIPCGLKMCGYDLKQACWSHLAQTPEDHCAMLELSWGSEAVPQLKDKQIALILIFRAEHGWFNV